VQIPEEGEKFYINKRNIDTVVIRRRQNILHFNNFIYHHIPHTSDQPHYRRL